MSLIELEINGNLLAHNTNTEFTLMVFTYFANRLARNMWIPSKSAVKTAFSFKRCLTDMLSLFTTNTHNMCWSFVCFCTDTLNLELSVCLFVWLLITRVQQIRSSWPLAKSKKSRRGRCLLQLGLIRWKLWKWGELLVFFLYVLSLINTQLLFWVLGYFFTNCTVNIVVTITSFRMFVFIDVGFCPLCP